MATMLPVTATQRRALRDFMVFRLFVVGDRRLAAAVIEEIRPEQVAVELAQDLRLMTDLGWDRESQGDVVLTMRRQPLELTLRRMRHDAVEARAKDVQPQRPGETKEDRMASFKLAERVCDELLTALD